LQTRSQHLLAEFRGCSVTKLNNLEFIEASMRAAAQEARATIVNSSFHKFGHQGVSGVLVLAESHLSVHTWPEHGYAATDIYVCGDTCLPRLAQASLARALDAQHTELMSIERGLDLPAGQGMRVQSHEPVLANLVDASADSSPSEHRTRPGPE
jgi:S-adenosylmethionine decarboxylase proenzyme